MRVENREGAVRLGRTMIRCPIVLEQLSWQEETGDVAYTGRPWRRAGPHDGVARWDVLTLIAHVVDHIPEPAQQMVRYWGSYANAARGKRRKAAMAQGATRAPRQQAADDEFTRSARLSWARLIRRV